MPLTLRVRSAAGMWRLTVPDATTTIQAVKAQIEQEKSIAVATQKLTSDPQGQNELDDGSRLDAAGLGLSLAAVVLVSLFLVALWAAPSWGSPRALLGRLRHIGSVKVRNWGGSILGECGLDFEKYRARFWGVMDFDCRTCW